MSFISNEEVLLNLAIYNPTIIRAAEIQAAPPRSCLQKMVAKINSCAIFGLLFCTMGTFSLFERSINASSLKERIEAQEGGILYMKLFFVSLLVFLTTCAINHYFRWPVVPVLEE